jgi:hypothetical protein
MRTKISLAVMAALVMFAAPVIAGITANILTGPFEFRVSGFDVDKDTASPGTLTINGILTFNGVSSVTATDLQVSGQDASISNFHCKPGVVTGSYFLDASSNVALVTLTWASGDACLPADELEFDVALSTQLGGTHQVSSDFFETTFGTSGPCEVATSGGDDLLTLLQPPGINGKKQRTVCIESLVLDGELVHQ